MDEIINECENVRENGRVQICSVRINGRVQCTI